MTIKQKKLKRSILQAQTQDKKAATKEILQTFTTEIKKINSEFMINDKKLNKGSYFVWCKGTSTKCLGKLITKDTQDLNYLITSVKTEEKNLQIHFPEYLNNNKALSYSVSISPLKEQNNGKWHEYLIETVEKS